MKTLKFLDNYKFIINLLLCVVGNLVVYYQVRPMLYGLIDMPFGGIFIIISGFITLINLTLLIASIFMVIMYFGKRELPSTISFYSIFFLNLIPLMVGLFLIAST